MKTVTNNNLSQKTEFFSRILYSFQVLTVGIALPLLFLVGISDGNQKKTDPEVKITTPTAPLSARSVVDLYIPRI